MSDQTPTPAPTFETVCPGCLNSNTLRYRITKTSYFPVIARPKRKNPLQGTYDLGAGFQLNGPDRWTECVEPGCGWSQSGPPTAGQIAQSGLIREV